MISRMKRISPSRLTIGFSYGRFSTVTFTANPPYHSVLKEFGQDFLQILPGLGRVNIVPLQERLTKIARCHAMHLEAGQDRMSTLSQAPMGASPDIECPVMAHVLNRMKDYVLVELVTDVISLQQ